MAKIIVGWDTDGVSIENCGLPEYVELDRGYSALIGTDDEEFITDWLSDTYGFCVKYWDVC